MKTIVNTPKQRTKKFACCWMILFVFFPLYLQGQDYMSIIEKSPTKNFQQIVNEVEAYYKNRDKGKGSGYNSFKRWEEFHKIRLDAKGNLVNTQEWYLNELYKLKAHQNNKSLAAQRFKGNWITHGPTSTNLGGDSNGIGSGRVNCTEIDPADAKIIYAGTPAGGLWRSEDNGYNWSCLTDGVPLLGVSGIAIDPDSPFGNRTIYILTGDGDGDQTPGIGVLKSVDNGITWQSTGLGSSASRGYKLLIHPDNSQILLAATANGIYKTQNGAVSWTKVSTFSIKDLEYNPANPNIAYAAGSNYFLRSLDGGNSWTRITGNGVPNHPARFAIAVTPAQPNAVYLVSTLDTGEGSFGGLFRSSDNGASFSLYSSTPNILGYYPETRGNQAFYDIAIAVNPTNANEIHVGGIRTYKSVDGGFNWTVTSVIDQRENDNMYNHVDIHSLEYDGSRLICGSDGGVSVSFPATSDTWYRRFDGLNISQLTRLSVDPKNDQRMLFGMQDNGTSISETLTATSIYGSDGEQCLIDPINSEILYFSGQYGDIQVSLDNGETHRSIKPTAIPRWRHNPWLTPFETVPGNYPVLYAGFHDVWRTYDRGTSWTNVTNGQIDTVKLCRDLKIAPSNSNVIYVAKEGDLHFTKDGGATWTKRNGEGIYKLPGLPITRIAVHPDVDTTLWVSVGQFQHNKKVYRSMDAGRTWVNLSSDSLPNVGVSCVVYYKNGQASGVYAGTDLGVFFLPDTNQGQWYSFNQGLPVTIIADLDIQRNRLYAATFGRGIWSSELQDCQYSIARTGTETGVQVYEADEYLTSTAQLTTNSSIVYKANQIRLLPGFRSNSSYSYFKAKAGRCGTTLRAAASSYVEGQGIFTGPMPEVIWQDPFATTEDNTAPESTLHVFPNPAEELTNMEFNLAEEADVTIEILNATGKTVKVLISKQHYAAGTYRLSADVSTFPPGQYICTFYYNGQKTAQQLIVR